MGYGSYTGDGLPTTLTPPWGVDGPWLEAEVVAQPAVRWVSLEPLLASVNLTRIDGINGDFWNALEQDSYRGGLDSNALDWVVVGGESGPNHRPMAVEWLSRIVDQCRFRTVPIYVKQDSGLNSGRQGRIPDDLWALKEFPNAG